MPKQQASHKYERMIKWIANSISIQEFKSVKVDGPQLEVFAGIDKDSVFLSSSVRLVPNHVQVAIINDKKESLKMVR